MIILLCIAIIVTNISPVSFLFSEWKWYHYTTKDGNFQFDALPAKGGDIDIMQRSWQEYKKTNHPTDTIIYRTFAINPLKFWLWRDYLTSPRYKYLYLNPDKINKNENETILFFIFLVFSLLASSQLHNLNNFKKVVRIGIYCPTEVTLHTKLITDISREYSLEAKNINYNDSIYKSGKNSGNGASRTEDFYSDSLIFSYKKMV